MKQIKSYLMFKDKTREAMKFYHQCFGGELTITPAEGTPLMNYLSPDAGQTVIHGTLDSDGIIMHFSELPEPGNNVNLMLDCESEEQLQNYYDKLVQGGNVIAVPDDTFWGAYFGSLTDKFGVSWHLNYYKNAA